MNSSAAFPREARLLEPAQFTSALKGRRVARGSLLMLHAGPPGVPERPRLGLVIGKRYAPLSVSRSAIKRVIREAFRQQQATLPPADYAVRMHSRLKQTSLTELKRQIASEIQDHFRRARKTGRVAKAPPLDEVR